MVRPFLPAILLTMILMSCAVPFSNLINTTNTSTPVTISVFFLDVARFQAGSEPYETPVMRTIYTPTLLPEAVLEQLFLGPNEAEKVQGLAVVLSGTTGFSNMTIKDGIARVYLTGSCTSQGATYTIANLINANLKQFPEIQWVKIFDQNNETENPERESDSIPFCLEP
jgi:spore germination protein GerM